MAKERIKTDYDRLLDDFKNVNSKRMREIMVLSDDEEFARNYFKILEYVAPKLQRTEIIDEKTKDREITITHKFNYEEDKEI